jgi:predicted AAA+ superfamily ATPase
MAVTNRDRVGRAMDIFATGLAPFVERQMDSRVGASWRRWVDGELTRKLERNPDGSIPWDSQALLKVMIDNWREVFSKTLGHPERALVGELIDIRNRWAHQRPFSYDDTHRALDSAQRLLNAVSAAAQAAEIDKMRQEVLRTMFAEQARQQTRRQSIQVEGTPQTGLKPWREVVTPHPDVASGRYVEAEFAADLAQVQRGDASKEYADPVEFFRRTYLTDGLTRLLESALRRLAGQPGGDPVIELQTNFGGGKTHSMLALHHVCGHDDPKTLPGVDQIMATVGLTSLPHIQRAVLVGTALSPSEVWTRGGAETRTLWGELAWQLLGADGYKLVEASDRNGVSPGSDLLHELLAAAAPCLILIDEWVAFVRQLYGGSGLPAGSFDANITFAQALTEAVKATPGALLVAALPQSRIEIGGEGGDVGLELLKNTFGRIESSWRPASADEGFEIVRRRLFQPMAERESFAARDAVIKAFATMYRDSGASFPSGCSEGDYRRRMEAAYPIHPELFDRLNNDWGSLERFQRTRGVLRLMANVIHCLWERGDKSLMILPSSIPLDDALVQSRVTRLLEQRWDAIISADVDGETSKPLAIDRENPNLARYSATRRVARTIFMASAPTYGGPNPGIDDRRIRLGCAQPGETPGSFGDALRRLADGATYLYVDSGRYWFSVQPSVTRTADDRASALDADDVWAELISRLRAEKERGPFAAVHVVPENSGEVPDEMEARLVVLGPDYPHDTTGESKAKAAAEEILTRRGQQPRIFRNALLFLAPDRRRLGELEQAMRLFMAWRSILRDQETLNLDAFQGRQADSKSTEWNKTVDARIGETWVWAMVPCQPDPKQPGIEWAINRVSGQDPIARRASKRFESDEALLTRLGPGRLRKALDQFSLWRDQTHIEIKQLTADFATYLYLPRLRDRQLVIDAVRAAISQLVCDHFAYADGYDATAERYLGLTATGGGSVTIDASGLLVTPERALIQIEKERGGRPTPGNGGDDETPPAEPPPPSLHRRFYASVTIDPTRAGRDVGRIAEEVIQHLTTLSRADVKLTLEVEADAPEGVPDDIQRIVAENCQTLKFTTHGFD